MNSFLPNTGSLTFAKLLTILFSRLFQAGYGLGDEDESLSMGGKLCAHVASSYIVSLRDMDMKHIKDFVFLHGKQLSHFQLTFAVQKRK